MFRKLDNYLKSSIPNKFTWYMFLLIFFGVLLILASAIDLKNLLINYQEIFRSLGVALLASSIVSLIHRCSLK